MIDREEINLDNWHQIGLLVVRAASRPARFTRSRIYASMDIWIWYSGPFSRLGLRILFRRVFLRSQFVFRSELNFIVRTVAWGVVTSNWTIWQYSNWFSMKPKRREKQLFDRTKNLSIRAECYDTSSVEESDESTIENRALSAFLKSRVRFFMIATRRGNFSKMREFSEGATRRSITVVTSMHRSKNAACHCFPFAFQEMAACANKASERLKWFF